MSDPHESDSDRRMREDTRTTQELVDAALASLADDDCDEHHESVRLLAFRGTIEEFTAARELCAAGDPAHRKLGVWIVRAFGCERRNFFDESVALLIAMLDDSDTEIIFEAAMALGYCRDERVITPVLAKMDHWDSDVRLGVAIALHGFTRSDAIAGTIELSRDPSSDPRDWATFNLSQLTGQQPPPSEADLKNIREALADRLHDENVVTRCSAISGLAQLKDPRVRAAIRTELLDDAIFTDFYAARDVFEAAWTLADPALYDALCAFAKKAADRRWDKKWSCLDDALETCHPAAKPPPDNHS